MHSAPLFSVVIPVYNVEKYLGECIESVLRQTYPALEVILVDDGSPDRSGAICDEYMRKDDRVKVIHKTNGGLSDARNAGIRRASGMYLLFLDSDDYWDDPAALDKLKAVIDSSTVTADVVLYQAKLLYPDGSMQPDRGSFCEDFNRMAPADSLIYLSEQGLLVGSACSKAVRREFLLKNNLFFKVGIKSEDIDWVLRMASCLPKYLYSEQFFYIYRKGRADSITSTIDIHHLQTFTDMLEEFCTFSYPNETVRRCLVGYVAYEFSILMAQAANLPANIEKKALLRQIRSMKAVLEYDIHPKVKKINLVKRMISFRATMFLLGLYLRHRKR